MQLLRALVVSTAPITWVHVRPCNSNQEQDAPATAKAATSALLNNLAKRALLYAKKGIEL